jgi:hypothetical protein
MSVFRVRLLMLQMRIASLYKGGMAAGAGVMLAGVATPMGEHCMFADLLHPAVSLPGCLNLLADIDAHEPAMSGALVAAQWCDCGVCGGISICCAR